jgi:hypothetical protein
MVSEPVDILLITWNRAAYLEKSLPRLFNTQDDIRVYWWDNGSVDGATDVVASIHDPRIVERRLSRENVLQAVPTLWFLERSKSDVIGKVDDDTLVPAGWTKPISDLVRRHDNLGMIGCWTYWPEDFERNRETASKKIITLGEHQILQDLMIGGTAFLMRKSVARQYLLKNPDGQTFPVDRPKMTIDGRVTGWYFPLLWAEHMDDPRSSHCLMNRPGGMSTQAALTARDRGFTAPTQYLAWIQSDADQKLRRSVRKQRIEYQWNNSLVGELYRKVRRRLA